VNTSIDFEIEFDTTTFGLVNFAPNIYKYEFTNRIKAYYDPVEHN